MENAETKGKPRRRDTNDVRAERKRELDRLAQRATRERTKNRIAFLEQKLASLESCDRESTISQLTKTIDDLRTENMRLQSAMMKMRFAINEALDGAEASASTTVAASCSCNRAKCICSAKALSTTSETPSADEEVVNVTPQNDVSVPIQDGTLGMWSNTTATNVSGIEEFLGFQPNTLVPPVFDQTSDMLVSPWPQILPTQQHSSTSSPSPFTFVLPPANGSQLPLAPDYEKWHVSNGAFTGAMTAIRNHLATNTTLDLHVPFRAGLWGWDSIPASEQSHPVWSAIRAVDQKVFGAWVSKAARIAVMYACQTMLQYREAPTKENLARVPKYLLPRPSQQRLQHPAVIDYLVWPGLRDRLVFEHEKYTRTGEFSAAFVKYAHFDWPYTDDDIFIPDASTGDWRVSENFLQKVYDHRSWSMLPGFFDLYPEMIHDIPKYEGDVVQRPIKPPRPGSLGSRTPMNEDVAMQWTTAQTMNSGMSSGRSSAAMV